MPLEELHHWRQLLAEKKNFNCPVCYNSFLVERNPVQPLNGSSLMCRHILCEECLAGLIRKQCPVCRKDWSEYTDTKHVFRYEAYKPMGQKGVPAKEDRWLMTQVRNLNAAPEAAPEAAGGWLTFLGIRRAPEAVLCKKD